MIIEWGSNPAIWTIVVSVPLLVSVGIWIGSVNSDRKSFKEFMQEVREDIKEILKRMPDPSPVGSNSPIQLTDFGKSISDTISAVDWAKDEASKLIDQANGKEEFEIFELCVSHIDNIFNNNSDFNKSVKENAYKIGTSSENVLKVYEVVLRDQLLNNLHKKENM